MSILERVVATLEQEGYRPDREKSQGEAVKASAIQTSAVQTATGHTVTFRYYGQPAAVHLRPLGAAAIASLECPLPRPAPQWADADAFARQHPLARLTDQDGRALLHIDSSITATDTGGQFLVLLGLLDTYAAAAVFSRDSGSGEVGSVSAEVASAEPVPTQPAAPVEPAVQREGESQKAHTPKDPAPPRDPERSREAFLSDPKNAAAATETARRRSQPASGVPIASTGTPGWDSILEILNERFHPLARELAALQAPVPDEVQMDMLQNRQVKGTAIMMWGSPPEAVVVCEPGQNVPEGYRGNTWLRHQTAEQVARETQAFLRAMGKA